MNKAVIYIHGKGGNANEAVHYHSLFRDCDVIGFDYKAQTPWVAREEFTKYFKSLSSEYQAIKVVANSIGAYFLMNADITRYIAHAYFISPIVDMEKLIISMMSWAGVTESELQKQGIIHTGFNEDLSWAYLCYVREYPVSWDIPTDILYGRKDDLTSIDAIMAFAQKHHASLTVMDNGEHWFHTEEQMQFLDSWIIKKIG